MRVFIAVIVLIFSLQSWTKADDISDFEIEGMSIGDSALNFFSRDQIVKNSRKYYKNKKFTPVQNDNLSFFKIYDAVDFNFMTGDNKYIIHNISGVILIENINDCIDKQNIIKNELALIFPNAVRSNRDKIYNHTAPVFGQVSALHPGQRIKSNGHIQRERGGETARKSWLK